MGFLAYTADYIPTTDSWQPDVTTCGNGPTSSIFALTPTVTPSGYSNPYQAPIGVEEWGDLVPLSIVSKCERETITGVAAAVAVVSALTTTSTQYDDYVHSLSSTAASTAEPKVLSTVNAKPVTTTDAQSTTTLKGNQASQPKTTTRAAEDNASTSNPITTSPSPIVISGVTITPGAPAVTVDGTEISLAASSSVLVVGTSTLNLAASSTPGYGSLVWSGLGGSGTAGSNTGPHLATFTGAGGKPEPTLHVKFVLICFIISGLLSGTL
jgi:hypothetical protein